MTVGRHIGSSVSAKVAAAALLVGLALAVELLVRCGFIRSFLLPPPSAVLARLPTLVTGEGLVGRFATTAGQMLLGGTVATLLGLGAGAALHHWSLARAAFIGWVVTMAAAPLLLLYPLFLVFFGRSTGAIIAMSTVAALPPIILKTCEGLDDVPRVLIDVARSYGLSRRQVFRRVRVPSALPAIFSGVRLGLAYALVGVVSTQYLTNLGGLGELVTDLADRYDMPGMYGAVLSITVGSAVLLASAHGVERWLLRHPL